MRGKTVEKKKNEGRKELRLRDILILQAVIVIYTLSSVMAKLASGEEPFSAPFLLFYLAELMILGIYAVLWQQMIKKFELSVAYTNRAMALLWSMLWAVVLFHDRVSVKNIIGVALVIAGTLIVNGGKEEMQ
ncbi:MAG TPA: DMT family transporter [Candidatus Eisenbergiella stercoravium]|nr:DMT family transporter [Candidatus Eisenbergiella stercoravium]